jgi:predicted HTH domain antitoxin
MNTITDLIIPKDILINAKMTPQELTVEIAVYLYEKKRLTLGQAKRFANLDQISFQKELAKRNVFLHYDTADVLKDIQNLGIKL